MRKNLILTLFCLLILVVTNAQNVGIGTTTPNAFFNVSAGKTILFGTDTTSVGNKLMWLPAKGAFRVGNYFGLLNDTIGNYSTAMGASIAKADHSTAMGNSSSTGQYSTAMGGSDAYGYASTAMGYSTASANYSTSMGLATYASGANSTAMGNSTQANSVNETVIGIYNDVSNTNRLFEIGDGNFNTSSNALTVLNNGMVGIGTTNPNALLEVDYASSTFTPQILLKEPSSGYARLRVQNSLGYSWTIASIRNSTTAG
jgi:hypothetical protein